MSQRETRVKPLALTVIAGVNQRVRDTELPPTQYSDLLGVFPEFAGLQSKIFGKRLLAKYDEAIYGIYQFWTPYGYGSGLYQFGNTLDYGPWLTPISNFNLDLPGLDWDGGYMTLDDFGNPYGSNFGYGTDNMCLISFLNGGTDHSACNPGPSLIGTPDDTNGGPGGQGRRCRWTLVPVVIDAVIGNYTHAQSDDGTTVFGAPLPYPLPLTAVALPPSPYVPGQGEYDGDVVAYYNESSSKTNLGFGNWLEGQGWDSFGKKVTYDLSAAIEDGIVPALTTLTFARNANAPFEYFEVILPVDYTEGGNFAAFELSSWDYIDLAREAAPNGLGGFTRSDFINAGAVTAYYNRRVCV